MEKVTLSNGVVMPIEGYGVYQVDPASANVVWAMPLPRAIA